MTKTKTVTLSPGQSKIVSFEIVPTEAKVYQVVVNGLTDSFKASPLVGIATIEGLVSDYWGNPLANIRVLLSEYINAERSFLTDAYTDSIGFYRFTVDLPAGKKYRVYCDAHDQGYWAPGKDCVTSPGINLVDFRLTPLP